jgi:hypothetical protein
MALALEEMGFSRYNGNNLLKNKKNKFKYVLITGNNLYSPNNTNEIEAVSSNTNNYGDKIKVVIISRAGSEGIDLKNIRNVHIMEPWYNMNRLEQVIGRAIRNKSHFSLPLEKRNCCIYLYGSLLTNKSESIDLFLYRLAEHKSIKIGKITRILKENSIDCILTKHEDIKYFDKDISSVELKLSNQNIISFDIGLKPFSNSCDYMETCHYNCMTYDNKYNKISIINDVNNNTYMNKNSELNVNDIIVKIKNLFKDKYYYSKYDIIMHICNNKIYPLNIIDYALNEIINNELIIILDRYDRKGKIIQIDNLYLFQPQEINNKLISYEERSRPIDNKNDKILIKFSNDNSEETTLVHDTTENDFLKNIIDTIIKIKYILEGSFYLEKKLKIKQEEERKREKKEQREKLANQEEERKREKKEQKEKIQKEKEEIKQQLEQEKREQREQKEQEKENKKLQRLLEKKRKKEEELKAKQNKQGISGGSLISSFNITNDEYIRSCIEIVFDLLSTSEKIYIINKFYILDESDINKYSFLNTDNISIHDIFSNITSFINSKILINEYDMKMIVIDYNTKLNCIIYDKNKWIIASEAYITLFTPLIKNKVKKYEKNSSLNKTIGLNINKNNKTIFKIKDTTNLDVHNKGWACSNLKKNNIKELLKEIFDNHDEVELLTNDTQYKINDLCNVIKFMFTYLNYISAKQKIWFLNISDTAIIKYTDTFKI